MTRRLRFGSKAWALASLGALAAMAAFAPGASADLTDATPDCPAISGGDTVFAPWGDNALYALTDGGSFEDGAAGWLLDGSSVVDGNESYDVGGAADSSSLAIDHNGSARSASVCVGVENPSMRFFVRSSGGGFAALLVKVRFPDANGDVRTSTIGIVGKSDSWQPSPVVPIDANLIGVLPGRHTPVQFKFVPLGSGDWQIDDVYVDPWRCC